MRKIITIITAVIITVFPAKAEQRHSSLVRSDIRPERVLHVEGDVSESWRMLMPGTGQAIISSAECCTMKGNSYVILDFGKEINGGIRIVTGAFDGGKTAKVRIRFGESVSETCSEVDGEGGATNDHAIRDFVTELPWLGAREFGTTGFRFVRIDLMEKDIALKIREISGFTTGSDDPMTGSFKCSDQRITDIWNTAARTVQLNMQEYIWDGIKRDRLVWIGDMYPEVMSICALFGNTDIVTRSLDFARDSCPLPGWMNGMSSYSIWWLMIQHEWYRHYGDMEYLKAQRTYLKGLLRQMMACVDENGREHLPEGRFLDWPSNINEAAEDCGLHALMIIALQNGAELCDALGESALAAECLGTRERLVKASPAIVEKYAGIRQAYDRPGMKQAAALMSLAGMTDVFRAADNLMYNGGHGFSTFYGGFMLEALASAGRYKEALDIISQYWGGMLDLGATSFWEDFDLDWMKNGGRIDEMPQPGKVDVHKTYGGYCYKGYRHSFCHGWASGPVSWIDKYILGIQPESVGQGTIYLEPHLCGLEWAEGTYPADQGLIKLRIEPLSDGRTLARVDAPEDIDFVSGHNVVIARKGMDMTQRSMNEIASGFRNVPDSIRIGTYWYWISDNISEEGVVKDLKAMKEAGITRAQLGSMGVDGVPYGNVKFLSDEWWKITRTALRTASELGIEIGIFNSPGWSQSGGPWVAEEQSMRYISCDEQTVTGDGGMKDIVIPTDGQLVRVLAYPAPEGKTIDTTFRGKDAIDLVLDEPVTVRSLTVSTESPIKTRMRLIHQGKVISIMHFDRSNRSLNVGWDPDAPVVISIPETTGVDFRFEVDNPEDAEIRLRLSEIPKVERYAEKSLAKMFQTPLPMWGEYMWDTPAAGTDTDGKIKTAEIKDLTASVKDGHVSWAVPEGRWVIGTFSMKTTGVTSPAVPEATGLEADKMSRKHIEAHFEKYLGEIFRRIPAAERACWKTVVQDSYETGGLNWTDDMEEAFANAYGYDPAPYLPVLCGNVVGSEEMSDRFLWDLRRLVADRVAYDYVGGLRDISHKYGLETWLENYGHWGFPSEFLMYGGQSDQISGEFWSEGDLGDIENRAASSAGHIYGKNQIWAESCTAGGPAFSRYPRVMKQRVDRFFTEGINSSLLHVYIQQPDDRKPGLDAWFGNEFNRNNTWFRDLDLFTGYLRRCNYMLQQGTYVADVAYFIGEDAPKMTGQCVPALPYGYSFDYINGEVLKDRAHVEDGCLVLESGMRYRVLVLPQQKTMRPEMLECIASLVRDGLTVVGPAPTKSPSLQGWPESDSRIQALASELWGGQTGKGRIYPDGTSLETVFSHMSLSADFKAQADGQLLYIHRSLGDEGDIYFISNQEDKPVSAVLSFKVGRDLRPELWNPASGEMSAIDYRRAGDYTDVSLDLDRVQSVFIVFRGNTGTAPAARPRTLPVSGTWKIDFEASAGNPAFCIATDRLSDWKDSADERVKYFSGTATYTIKYNLLKSEAKASKVELDLGMAMVTAKVKVNGTYAGGAWPYPFRVDVTGLLHNGENTIEITVTNNWQNRLIGDQNRIESARKTWTNDNPWEHDSELQSSGLIGPVNILTYR